ncbi:MAG: dethiobiotin synthase [Bacteroidales bacterium]|nr:dethiobiotin synthase [Bacteroidales bacterium]
MTYNNVIFVSGIDTDAGKTYATGWLARYLMDTGLRVATMKFIQTGCKVQSDDLLLHRRLMGINDLPEDADHITSPVIFTYPASPHLAAKIDGRSIDLQVIDDAIARLSEAYDLVLVEGAGGLMVPLSDTFLTIDYPHSRRLPVALVTNGHLGSISHTLLALEALKSRGIPLECILYNHFFDTDPVISADTHQWLRRYVEREFPSARWVDVPNLGKSGL